MTQATVKPINQDFAHYQLPTDPKMRGYSEARCNQPSVN
jgi:hypothetical protein